MPRSVARTELSVALDGKFLGYGPFHYQYPTGREGDTFVVAMMDGAQALSIYVLGGDGGQWLVEGTPTGSGRCPSSSRASASSAATRSTWTSSARSSARLPDQHADAVRAGVSEGRSGGR